MLFSLFVNHFIVPNANKGRLEFEEKYYRDVMVVEDYHAEYPGNQSVYFSNFNNRDKRINDFTFQQWGDNHKPVYFVKSRYAINKPGTNHWELNEETKPYFEMLKSVSIFHETPESAAQQMIKVWDDVDGWWHSKQVQDTRKIFCYQYSRLPGKPIGQLKNVLQDVAETPR